MGCRPQLQVQVQLQRTAHFQSRRVREVALRRLRMVVPTVPHGAARGADREAAAVELVARAIPKLCRLIHDLNENVSRRGRGLRRGKWSGGAQYN